MFYRCNIRNELKLVAIKQTPAHSYPLRAESDTLAARCRLYRWCNIRNELKLVAIKQTPAHSYPLRAESDTLAARCRLYRWCNIRNELKLVAIKQTPAHSYPLRAESDTLAARCRLYRWCNIRNELKLVAIKQTPAHSYPLRVESDTLAARCRLYRWCNIRNELKLLAIKQTPAHSYPLRAESDTRLEIFQGLEALPLPPPPTLLKAPCLRLDFKTAFLLFEYFQAPRVTLCIQQIAFSQGVVGGLSLFIPTIPRLSVPLLAAPGRKRQLKRNQWTKDWLLNRAQYSHVNLLKELRFHPKDWHNYLRMNEETFFSPKQLYELKNSFLQELIALTTQCNVNKKKYFFKQQTRGQLLNRRLWCASADIRLAIKPMCQAEMMNFHHAISSNFWLELTSFEQTFAYTQSIRLVSSACSHRIDKPI
ncbi:hypothetical protein J6590_047407 [Homalodisca vitripennis]|nr:hypothetical protein J6590_047407 [Homalodisca vitripennis]